MVTPLGNLCNHALYERSCLALELRWWCSGGRTVGRVGVSFPGEAAGVEHGALAVALKGAERDGRG